jgi:hypothetical protein
VANEGCIDDGPNGDDFGQLGRLAKEAGTLDWCVYGDGSVATGAGSKQGRQKKRDKKAAGDQVA